MPTAPKAATANIDAATVVAVLEQVRETERRAKIRAKEHLESDGRVLVWLYGRTSAAQLLRPDRELANPNDIVHLPADAVVWPGSLIEVPAGFGKIQTENTNDPSRPLSREATAEEYEGGVTIQLASRFEREEAAVFGAEKYAASVAAGNASKVAEIEKLERKLADARKDLEAGLALEVSAGKMVEAEKSKLAAWIERSGKSESAIRAARELMHRQPPPEPSGKGYALSPGHELDGEDWKARLARLNREADAKAAVAVGAQAGGLR